MPPLQLNQGFFEAKSVEALIYFCHDSIILTDNETRRDARGAPPKLIERCRPLRLDAIKMAEKSEGSTYHESAHYPLQRGLPPQLLCLGTPGHVDRSGGIIPMVEPGPAAAGDCRGPLVGAWSLVASGPGGNCFWFQPPAGRLMTASLLCCTLTR